MSCFQLFGAIHKTIHDYQDNELYQINDTADTTIETNN